MNNSTQVRRTSPKRFGRADKVCLYTDCIHCFEVELDPRFSLDQYTCVVNKQCVGSVFDVEPLVRTVKLVQRAERQNS